MEFNRNSCFMIGLVLLFIGVQLRYVDSFVLNEKASRFVAEKFGSKAESTATQAFHVAGFGDVAPRHVLRPPRWAGWAFIAVGAVLVLHSLALRRPG